MKLNFKINRSLALLLHLQAYTVKERIFHVGGTDNYCKEHSFYSIQILYFCFEITGKGRVYALPPEHPDCRCVAAGGK